MVKKVGRRHPPSNFVNGIALKKLKKKITTLRLTCIILMLAFCLFCTSQIQSMLNPKLSRQERKDLKHKIWAKLKRQLRGVGRIEWLRRVRKKIKERIRNEKKSKKERIRNEKKRKVSSDQNQKPEFTVRVHWCWYLK